MFEYMIGSESHTSSWGKFYIRGFEKIQAQEDHAGNRRDRHGSYQFYMADAKPGTVFTVFEQNGSKGHTDEMKFWICKVTDGQPVTIKANYGKGFVTGSFEIIATGQTPIKAKRLLEWWNYKPTGVNLEAFARHCADNIQKRGVAVLPPLPQMEAA